MNWGDGKLLDAMALRWVDVLLMSYARRGLDKTLKVKIFKSSLKSWWVNFYSNR